MAKVVYPQVLYHGTRCSKSIILSKGLIFDREFLVSQIKRACGLLGIDFDSWSSSGKEKLHGGAYILGRICGDVNSSYRPRIWVTETFSNAASYAQRNPEILEDAIKSLFYFKYPRRRSESFFKEIDSFTSNFLKSIGTPKVVEISTEVLGVKIRGTNIPLSERIPPEAIVRVVEVEERDEQYGL